MKQKKKGGFLGLLLGSLGTSLLGNSLTSKRTCRAGEGANIYIYIYIYIYISDKTINQPTKFRKKIGLK